MSRYIDADKIKYDEIYKGDSTTFEFRAKIVAYKEQIDKIPYADVVEVVRCKDCKHKPNGYTDDDVLRYPNFPHEENNPCPCQVYEDKWYSWIPNDDFYCSYGEKP